MLEIFDGTIIAKIAEVAKSGDFSALKLTDPVLDTDIVVGYMTDLEKAVFTLLFRQRDELEQLNTPQCECGDAECEVCKCEEQTKDTRIHTVMLRSQIDILGKFGWHLIWERLPLVGCTISLREGFKIVRIDEDEQQPRARIEIIGIGFGGPGFGLGFLG